MTTAVTMRGKDVVKHMRQLMRVHLSTCTMSIHDCNVDEGVSDCGDGRVHVIRSMGYRSCTRTLTTAREYR